MMRLHGLLSTVSALALFATPAFADGGSEGGGVAGVNGKHGVVTLSAPDVGAVQCIGTCAQHAAFVTALATVSGYGAAALQTDLDTNIGDFATALEWRADQIKAGGPVAIFVKGRYSLSDTAMSQVFTLANAAVTLAGQFVQFLGLSAGQITGLAPVAASNSGLDLAQGSIDLSQATGILQPENAPDFLRMQEAAPQYGFTPSMFGARCNSNGTPGSGADDTAALQSAINTAELTGQRLYLPARSTMCRTTAPLVISYGKHLALDGDYCEPYTNSRALANTPGPGSWLYFDHAGIGISIPADGLGAGATGTATGDTSSVATTGSSLQNFCTYRNQPAFVSSGSWAPNTNDYDISALQDDTIIRHVVTLNPTKAVKVDGRYTIDDLRGDPYLVGIDSELSVDLPRISNVHFWNFDTINTPAIAYQRANLQALILGRIDNPFITNFFSINAKICVHLISTPNGVPSKIHGVNIDCDEVGNTGLLSEAPGATGQFVNFTTQGDDKIGTAAGNTDSYNGVDINAANNVLYFGGLRATKYGGVAVIAPANSGTTVTIDGLYVDTWGINGNSGTAAVEADTGATINIGAGPVFAPGSVTSTKWAGSGTVNAVTSSKVN